ncbi:MAG: PulJ/GspJ family protein [Acidimicrobiales bacterium]
MPARLRGDDGVTLVELLTAIVFMVTISGVMAMALSVTFRSDRATSERLAESHDAQLVSIYLPSDIQSADPDGISAGQVQRLDGCDQELAGTNVLALSRAPVEDLIISYRVVEGDELQLVRHECIGGAVHPLVVAHHLGTQGAAASFVDGLVTMTVTEISEFEYTITGHPRTPES